MNVCKPCPSTYSAVHGFDPEALDLLNDSEYCNDPDFNYLYCPWENRNCPAHLKQKKLAAKLHALGKPLPWKLHPRFEETK